MCGIFGVVHRDINQIKFKKSLDLLDHRGPDNKNSIFFEKFAFGHTRLSIQDLTQSGNQPMFDEKENCIIYNGEIYNFKKLREILKKKNISFKTNTDTEVILNNISFNGIDNTLKNLEGMFSFAYYDRYKSSITIVRDKFGMKPLYFCNDEKFGFIFSSEIKPINFFLNKTNIDNLQLTTAAFLGLHAYPKTNFKDIYEVLPGEKLIYYLNDGKIEKKKYFSLDQFVDKDYYNHLSSLSLNQILNEYDQKLKNAVSNHLISDAETSVAYSAGIDSSLIARYAYDFDKKIKCFFFNSENKNYKKIAETVKKNINDNLMFYNEKKFESIINLPKMVNYSENILNPSGSALQLLTSYARDEGVKSMLTGDAADELFGGYNAHMIYYNQSFFNKSYIFKNFIKLANYIFPGLNRIEENFNNNYLPDYMNNREILTMKEDIILNESFLYKNWLKNYSAYSFLKSDFDKNMQSFLLHYFQTNIKRFLFRSDISGMQNSVELRIPFLDDNFVKLALNTPFKHKMSYKFFSMFSFDTKFFLNNKIILGKLAKLKGGIDNSVIYRKKTGIPMNYLYAKHILEKINTSNLRDLLKLSKLEFLKLLEHNNHNHLVWSFLQTEFFLRVFLNNEKYEKISDEIQSTLYNYNI